MRRGVLVVPAAAAALLVAPAAGAGIAASLSVNPSVVDVGTAARIELRVYSVNHGVKRLDDRSGRRLRVEVVSPEGWVERVVLRHVSRGVWRGTYVFGGAGKWQLRVASWPNGRAPRLSVRVRPTEPAAAPARLVAVERAQWRGRIVYSAGANLAFTGTKGLVIANARLRNGRRIRHTTLADGSPVWSPNGEWIALRHTKKLHRSKQRTSIDYVDILSQNGRIRRVLAIVSLRTIA